MAATATVPRSAGNGVALVVVAIDAAISAVQSLRRAVAAHVPAASSGKNTSASRTPR